MRTRFTAVASSGFGIRRSVSSRGLDVRGEAGRAGFGNFINNNTFVYWILLFVVVIAGFGTMFGFGMSGFTFGSFIKGIFMIVIGSALVRIWCELLIVLFKINENVQRIADSK